jgi:hypothetical protein
MAKTKYGQYVIQHPINYKGDWGAEVEMDFGTELEKHIVTSTASFYVPKGLIHGPFMFRKVTKPILFIHSMMAPKYYKTEVFK